jgi:hypothetical protein
MRLSVLLFILLAVAACKNAPKETAAAVNTATAADSAALVGAVSEFYNWYITTGVHELSANNMVLYYPKDGFYALDESILDKKMDIFARSGKVASQFIERERRLWKACAAEWATTPAGDKPPCYDSDPYLCSQDTPIEYYQEPASILRIDGEQATLRIPRGEYEPLDISLVKENGQWLVSKIHCDMGITFND